MSKALEILKKFSKLYRNEQNEYFHRSCMDAGPITLPEEKESTDAGFDNWKMALNGYKTDDGKHDKEFSAIFKGSKLTSRFIFRSVSAQSKALYDKDVKEFGKTKIDDLVDKVLAVLRR